MSDDIVTRLRNSCDHLCVGCTEENAHDVGMEAADEIESLRWGLETSRQFLDQARNGYQNLQEEIDQRLSEIQSMLDTINENVLHHSGGGSHHSGGGSHHHSGGGS